MTRILIVAIILCATTTCAEETAQELVSKAVARSRAIKSGCVEYFDDAQPAIVVQHNFGDGRWRVTSRGAIVAEYGNMRIHFGKGHPPVKLLTPEQASIEDANDNFASYLVPACAGGFWHTRQVDWVESHAADFVKTGTERLGDIDTVICDAYVKGSGSGPVIALHPLLRPTYKGLEVVRHLRLYIAPALGYVLPKIEILGGTDTVLQRWTATDFKECSLGIYIAKHIKEEYAKEDELALDPTTCLSKRFTVSADKMNQPLSDDDLFFPIPAGTKIVDHGIPALFKTKDAISSKDLARLSEKVGRLPSKERRGIKPFGLD